jgi:hypothetical protein
MSASDWRTIGTIATIVSSVIALHGITSKQWQRVHTWAVVAGVASVIGPRLTR